MQHFDIATVRATSLSADEALQRLSDAIDLIVIPQGESFPIDLTIEALPVDDFSVSTGFLPILSQGQRRSLFKASSKARTLDRKQARATKRASSYLA